MNLGILASHEGTTLQAVLDACTEGHLNANVTIVISNNSKAGAMGRAQEAGVSTCHISSKTHPGEGEEDKAIFTELTDHKVDYVLLLGYMKKLGPATLKHYSGRILNTHPSLLPKFGGQGLYGRKVHEAVLAAGEEVTGATIHLVEGEYDTGPLLSQLRVPILASDNADVLEARVKRAEQKLLINTLIELASPLEVSNY